MIKRKFGIIVATVIIGCILCVGIVKLAGNSTSAEIQNSSQSNLHYELPQLIPTTWIGRK
jgi:hypothetical protein